MPASTFTGGGGGKMKKSTFSLGVAVLGVFGAIIVYTLGNNPNRSVELQFFAGTALMGASTYVIAKRAGQ